MKVCHVCGTEMCPSPPLHQMNMGRGDWHTTYASKEQLRHLLKIMQEPIYWCHSCIDRGREEIRQGIFLTPEECLAELLGCTAEEALAKIEEHKRHQTPDDELIVVTIDDIKKALELP